MLSGGGPACLRLRIVLSNDELNSVSSNVFLTNALYETLTGWVKQHYCDKLRINDLADPKLLNKSRTALGELTKLLNIGSIYSFQT